MLYNKVIRITRSKKRDKGEKLLLEVDGENVSGSSLRETQDKLTELLNLSYEKLTNTGFLTSKNAGEFASATDSRKKELLQEFIPELVFKAKQESKNLLSSKKQEKIDKDKEKVSYETAISIYSRQVEEVEQDLEKTRLELEEITKQVELAEVPEKPEVLYKKIADIDSLIHMGRQAKNRLIKLEANYKEKLSQYKDASTLAEVCPTCGQDWSIAKSNKEKKVSRIKEEGKQARIDLDKFKESYTETNEDELQKERYSLQEQITGYNNELNKYNELLRGYRVLKGNYSSLQDKDRENKEKIAINKDKLSKVDKEILNITKDIKMYKFWTSAYSSKGIVAYILDNVLANLQDAANNILNYLTQGSVSLVINSARELKDSTRKEEITIDVHINGKVAEYHDLSGGEATRVDIAVALALRELYEKFYGGAASIVILDEIFATLDKEGVQALVNYLKRQFKKSQVFLITHKDELADYFNNKVYITKSISGKSTVKVN